jgi:Transposase, Mutator family
LTWKSTRRYALMASIVPSERLRRELEEIVAGAGGADDPIEAIGRLGARLILQQALEEELTEFLSRERYGRRGEPIVYRNGYERATVRTTAGPLELERVGCINPVAPVCREILVPRAVSTEGGGSRAPAGEASLRSARPSSDFTATASRR